MGKSLGVQLPMGHYLHPLSAAWGTWGLIVGVPIFTFLLDVLGIKSAKKSKKKANK